MRRWTCLMGAVMLVAGCSSEKEGSSTSSSTTAKTSGGGTPSPEAQSAYEARGRRVPRRSARPVEPTKITSARTTRASTERRRRTGRPYRARRPGPDQLVGGGERSGVQGAGEGQERRRALRVGQRRRDQAGRQHPAARVAEAGRDGGRPDGRGDRRPGQGGGRAGHPGRRVRGPAAGQQRRRLDGHALLRPAGDPVGRVDRQADRRQGPDRDDLRHRRRPDGRVPEGGGGEAVRGQVPGHQDRLQAVRRLVADEGEDGRAVAGVEEPRRHLVGLELHRARRL